MADCDSKRGPLLTRFGTPHRGWSAATLNQEKSEKRRQETPCSRLGDTREGIPHNATHHGATPPRGISGSVGMACGLLALSATVLLYLAAS